MAGSQYGVPVIVGADSHVQLLSRIALVGDRANHYNELWLQKLVFECPEMLPVEQIDSGYEGLIPVCMELGTPSGFIDALYVTPRGKLVVLEAKLWRNSEARREVVSQILHYAQALSGLSYEGLLKQVCITTKRKGNALFDIVREKAGPLDEQAFIDGVSRSLRTSEFLLLIVGDGIREGTGAIANFLEGAGRFNFTFGLVEMGIFDLGDGRRLVQPRVLAQTVLIERPRYTASEPRLSESGPPADDRPDDDPKELTARESMCLDFWKGFVGQLKLDDQTQPLANIRPWSSIDFPGPPKSNSWFAAKTGPAGSGLATVSLGFSRGPVADSIFRELEAQRETIDTELAIPVQWVSKDGKHSVVAERRFGGEVLLAERRNEAFAFLSDTLNRFVNAFRERIVDASRQPR